jgi:hypothetical protein
MDGADLWKTLPDCPLPDCRELKTLVEAALRMGAY